VLDRLPDPSPAPDPSLPARTILTRRNLLRAGASTGGGIVAATLAACTTPAVGGWTTVSSGIPSAPTGSGAPSPAAPAPSASAPSGSHGTEHSAAPSTAPSGSPAAVDHDAHAKAVVDRFLGGEGKTLPAISPPLQPRLEAGVKVFELTIDEIEHRIDAESPALAALGFQGMWPGPRIEVDEGDRIRAIFTNHLSEPTGVHFHGQRLPNAMDGVPHITQPPIQPGASFAYEFTATTTGSHMYHSHHNATDQVGRGLLGAFIVQPKDASQRYDQRYGATQDIVWISNDTLGGFTINGRGFPATEPIVAQLGDTIVIRFMNEGQMTHPWHLHGMPMRVVARDGYPLGAAAFTCDTLGVNPGERWDVVIECDAPGAWAFHCHVLSHAEGQDGMYGMVTALIVQDAAAALTLQQAGAPAFACVIPTSA
jgi:FtsP/CotA-like multicopper oxidase with cupredoxin domain